MKGEAYDPVLCDNAFAVIPDGDVPWTEAANGLPPGVLAKRFQFDPVMGRRASKVRFPPGYIEPEHTHKGWHSLVVLEGRMCVAGKDLRPGDCVFGWDLPHGPFEYPDGCTVFTVAVGESMHHEWEWAPFLAYERQWAPETPEGEKGCVAFDAWRRERRAEQTLAAAR